MEQKQELEPMTPEQIEAEAAYAKKAFLEYSNPSPELRRKISESIRLHRRSKAARLIKAASLTAPKSI